ncbi:MAG: hypothetical protein NTV01_03890 [Bacteroidia bacterium]|nr:hypothetical protein [Bacteroidia bacterium]
MNLNTDLSFAHTQAQNERILVRARESCVGQIFFSYWSPDFLSAEKELQLLKGYDVDVDLVKDGKIIKSYRRREI